VNHILGPDEDLTDILSKSLRQARTRRESDWNALLSAPGNWLGSTA